MAGGGPLLLLLLATVAAAVPSLLRVAGVFIFLTSFNPVATQEAYNSDPSNSPVNCTSPDNFVSFYPTKSSHFDEVKVQQDRNTNNNKQYYDGQRLNRYLDDERLNQHSNDQNRGRFSEDKIVNRNYDDLLSDRHKDTQDPNEILAVRPLSKDLDTEKSDDNKYPGDYNSHRNFDDEYSKKQLDDQYLKKSFDNVHKTVDDHLNTSPNREYVEKDVKEQTSDVHFSKQSKENSNDKRSENNDNGQTAENRFNDHYLSRPYEDRNSNKYLDDLQPDRRNYGQHFERHLIDQNPDLRINNQNFERHQIDQQSNDYNGNFQSNRRFDNENFDRHPVEQNPSKHLVDDYYSNRYQEEINLKKYLDNVNSNKHESDNLHSYRQESVKLIENLHSKQTDDLPPGKHVDDLRSDKRVENPNLDRRIGDLYSDTRIDNLSPDRHIGDSHLDIDTDRFHPHIDDLPSNRRIDNAHANNDDLHPERRDPPSDKHTENLNPGRPIDDFNIDKTLDNPRPERPIDTPSFERRLPIEESPKHLDDLHPDRRLKDQNYERRVIDQQIEKHLGVDVHTDRRVGEDDYNGHRSPNRYKDGSFPDEEEIYPDRRPDDKALDGYTTTGPRKESNASHLMTFTLSKDWEENKPKLNFPKKIAGERYRMATLHLDKGLFLFDFLRSFLFVIQPRDIPLDLLRDTLEGKINVSTVITQSLRLEMVFIVVISVLALLMFVVPGTEFWLCCRPRRYNYQRKRHSSLVFFLALYCFVMGTCVVTMMVCNEQVAGGIDKIPDTIEAAFQDLRDYHTGTAVQLRKCLTRSLDVASEAILGNLDNVEELLGKPVQAQLSAETGVDVALEALMDVANASHELSYTTDALIKRAERAREFGAELSREADELRRELERTARECAPEDRSLCAVLDPTGLHLALRLDRVARDDRLLRLRAAGRDNLTESGRQARGEYLYVTHHVDRNTLEARNQIRREINTARAKVSDEARSIEASGTDLSNQLDTARRIVGQVQPYVHTFEYSRWFVGFGTAMCVLFVWLLLFGALCCRCGASEGKVRPTLLWFVFFSCIISMALWVVVIAALTVASHAEMLLCRPLDDPEYRTVEAVLETRVFLGRRLSVPLKDLFDKCEHNDSAFPAFQLDNTMRMEQLTAHWTWTGLTRAFGKLRVDITGLRILSANLRERLQNLLYASGSNLTEHRVMIQGPILNKDLNALSDQVENVARQLTERRTARRFQTIAAQMRDLLSRRVKPMMKMQDELVYQLASLDVHLQPLQRQVNQTLGHLRNVQYFIDNQGEKIAQLKTKAYIDRLSGYLDQWRAHVLTEMSSGASKCRPLWDILRGVKLLVCSHILGPLNGFWFATLICAVTMLACTPSAHSLASSYWKAPSRKGSILLPSRGSPDTVVMERETWRSPNPPPSMDSW